MAKRRTGNIQRRSRASEEALTRRLGSGGGRTLDWRVLTIGAILILGLVILVVFLLFGGGGGPNGSIGTPQRDDGGVHIAEGTAGVGYSSIPGTSGQHWNTATSPGPWGVYTAAQPQERMIHNLEHGGIVIWYQPAQLDADGIAALALFVNQQIATERFKVILTPWSGADFGHPIAVTAWNWLLYLDTPDVDQVRAFYDDHYGQAPEPLGGPAQPAS